MLVNITEPIESEYVIKDKLKCPDKSMIKLTGLLKQMIFAETQLYVSSKADNIVSDENVFSRKVHEFINNENYLLVPRTENENRKTEKNCRPLFAQCVLKICIIK